MKAFHSSAAPQFPQLAVKTFAAHPVWKGSTRSEVKFHPIAKRDAVRIFHHARRFERQTAITRRDAFGRSSNQGKLGRMGIIVLHTLLFDFLNYRSGRLDPSISAIADKACVSVRSVFRALAALRAAGVVDWVKRCREFMDEARYVLMQDTNAYGVNMPGQWRGYRPPPDAPKPYPEAWGASPSLPGAIGLAAEALASGDARRADGLLASDPGDGLAAALLRLARRRGA